MGFLRVGLHAVAPRRRRFGGMSVPDAKRLKQLEAENAKLKRMRRGMPGSWRRGGEAGTAGQNPENTTPDHGEIYPASLVVIPRSLQRELR